jgi:hypothetical protein
VDSLGIRERKNRICSAPNFERARFLKVVALEEELRSSNSVERMRSEDRSPVNARSDARMRFTDGVPSGRLKTCRFGLWRGAHGLAWRRSELLYSRERSGIAKIIA